MMNSTPSNQMILWNANGLRQSDKRTALTELLSRVNPFAVALTETKFDHHTIPSITGNSQVYHEFSTTHTNQSAGVSLVVHRAMDARRLHRLSSTEKDTNSNSALTVLTVELSTPHAQAGQTGHALVIAVVYIKPDATKEQQSRLAKFITKISKYADQKKARLLLAGDFNTHSVALGSSHAAASTRNQLVADALIAPSIHCANAAFKSGPTHKDGGTLDLVLSLSPELITGLRVCHDELTRLSDHAVLCATTNFTPPPLLSTQRPKWKLRDADWPAYTVASHAMANEARNAEEWDYQRLIITWSENRRTNRTHAQITANRLAKGVTDQINASAAKSIDRGLVPQSGRDRPLTTEVRALIQQRRREQRRHAKVRHNTAKAAPIEEKMAHLRTAIRSAQSAEWRTRFAQKCDAIMESDGIHAGRVNYTQFDRTIGRSNVRPTQIADEKGNHPKSVPDSLNNFARYQSTIYANPPVGRDYQSKRDRRCDRNTLASEQAAEEWDKIYRNFIPEPGKLDRSGWFSDPMSGKSVLRYPAGLEPFPQSEINTILDMVSKNTAPGDDGIHNRMLSNAGVALRTNIATLVNFCHRTGVVPQQWKTVKTIALYKSGPAHDPSNYRTISLNPTLLKVLECAVMRRLQTNTPDSAFADTQFGFRPKRATSDALHFVLTRIRRSFTDGSARDQFLPTVFLDISKAFDRVRPSHVINALIERGANPISIRWLQSYLAGRSFYVSEAGIDSNPYPAVNGTPQGAILSPFLFLNFIDEVTSICADHGVTAVLFADDICLLPNENGYGAFRQLQKALDALTEWAHETHTTFNVKPSKSSAVLFTRLKKDAAPREQQLRLAGGVLTYEQTYKYLGVQLDARLDWKTQAKAAVTKATGTGFQISRIIHRSRSFSVHCIASLIRTILIPRCLYASQFWCPIKSTLAKLNSQIVKPLKRALGLPFSSHSLSVLVECNVLTAGRYVEMFAANFVRRAQLHPDSNPSTKAVATNISRTLADEKRGAARHSSKHDIVLPRSVMTTIAPLIDNSITPKEYYHKLQLIELQNAHWGSSMRLSLPSYFQLGKQSHLFAESIAAAQKRAKFRFDTISAWREWKTGKRGTPKCKWCRFQCARAIHFLRCPGLRATHRRHSRTLAPIRRMIAAVPNVTPCRRHLQLNQSVTQSIMAGYHPLLQPSENKLLLAASQLFIASLIRTVMATDATGE